MRFSSSGVALLVALVCVVAPLVAAQDSATAAPYGFGGLFDYNAYGSAYGNNNYNAYAPYTSLQAYRPGAYSPSNFYGSAYGAYRPGSYTNFGGAYNNYGNYFGGAYGGHNNYYGGFPQYPQLPYYPQPQQPQQPAPQHPTYPTLPYPNVPYTYPYVLPAPAVGQTRVKACPQAQLTITCPADKIITVSRANLRPVQPLATYTYGQNYSTNNADNCPVPLYNSQGYPTYGGFPFTGFPGYNGFNGFQGFTGYNGYNGYFGGFPYYNNYYGGFPYYNNFYGGFPYFGGNNNYNYHGAPFHYYPPTCVLTDVTVKVSDRCSGKQTCTASSSSFDSTECNKYLVLETDYACVAPSTPAPPPPPPPPPAPTPTPTPDIQRARACGGFAMDLNCQGSGKKISIQGARIRPANQADGCSAPLPGQGCSTAVDLATQISARCNGLGACWADVTDFESGSCVAFRVIEAEYVCQ